MKSRIILLAGFLLVLLVPGVHASSNQRDRSTLKGLGGVYVLTGVDEEAKKEWEKEGVTTALLQTRVEGRLRQVGIRVWTKTEGMQMLGRPTLILDLVSDRYENPPRHVWSMRLYLLEGVRLERDNNKKTAATTWEHQALGEFPVGQLHGIYEPVDFLMDAFINDYLAENPK